MTTFTLAFNATDDGDPSSVPWTTPVEGNAAFAIVNERSGVGQATLTVTDDSDDSWVKIASNDQELGDGNARQSASLWWRKVSAADEAFVGDTITVTGDSTTGSVSTRLTVWEYLPSAAYDWTFIDESTANSGTGSTPPLLSGEVADPGGSDLFWKGFGCWRNDGTTPPSAPTFSLLAGADTLHAGPGNGRSHASSFSSTGEAAAAKNTSMSWTGSGSEAICGLVVFSDGAIGGGGRIMSSLAGPGGLAGAGGIAGPGGGLAG